MGPCLAGSAPPSFELDHPRRSAPHGSAVDRSADAEERDRRKESQRVSQAAGDAKDHEAQIRERAMRYTSTMPSVSSLPEIEPHFGADGHPFEECEHIVHDHDPDTALCGVDQTNVPWNQGLPPCQACVAVAQGRMS